MTITMLPTAGALPAAPPAPPDSHTEQARTIRVAVRTRSRELRAKHRILAHQDALGSGFLALATVGVLGIAVAYALGAIAWRIAVPAAVVFMGIAHEIEHDAIHRL
jgi:hypothetical protein